MTVKSFKYSLSRQLSLEGLLIKEPQIEVTETELGIELRVPSLQYTNLRVILKEILDDSIEVATIERNAVLLKGLTLGSRERSAKKTKKNVGVVESAYKTIPFVNRYEDKYWIYKSANGKIFYASEKEVETILVTEAVAWADNFKELKQKLNYEK